MPELPQKKLLFYIVLEWRHLIQLHIKVSWQTNGLSNYTKLKGKTWKNYPGLSCVTKPSSSSSSKVSWIEDSSRGGTRSIANMYLRFAMLRIPVSFVALWLWQFKKIQKTADVIENSRRYLGKATLLISFCNFGIKSSPGSQ